MVNEGEQKVRQDNSMVIFHKKPLLVLITKTIVLTIFVLLPILGLWIGQEFLAGNVGEPDPSNMMWIGIVISILLWYVISFALLFPRLGRIIEKSI